MARPTKLTYVIQRQISENIALGLSYALAAESAGVTYQTFNTWMNKGKNSTSGKYYQFYKHIQKRNADAAKTCLERLNDAVEDGNCQVCMWILERRFPEKFGRHVYRKTNVVSENKNENVEISVSDADRIREKILEKFALGREQHESSTM
jgi:transposase